VPSDSDNPHLVSDPLPLTVAIIARDEADRITGAITGLPAAEVIVIDSGSTDGTPAIARSLGATVIIRDWPGHVIQKNRALEAATQPWVLSLDADEAPDAELVAAIRAVIEADDPRAGFRVIRRNYWQGEPVRGGSFRPSPHPRLVRRGRGRWGGEDPHDRLIIDGPVGDLPGFLEHHPYRDLGEHLSTIDRYTARFVEVSLAAGRTASWSDVLLRPLFHWFKALALQGGWRDGARGVALAWLGATHVALKWGRLRWRRDQK